MKYQYQHLVKKTSQNKLPSIWYGDLESAQLEEAFTAILLCWFKFHRPRQDSFPSKESAPKMGEDDVNTETEGREGKLKFFPTETLTLTTDLQQQNTVWGLQINLKLLIFPPWEDELRREKVFNSFFFFFW